MGPEPPSLLEHRGVFVAGTDTGVGKTVVTAGLTGWLRDRGVRARAIKPAQTGAPEDDDAAYVAAAVGDEDASRRLRAFGPALAPRVAAAREGEAIDYPAVRADVEAALDATEFGVVEGIGGLRVPITEDVEVLDLAAELELPTIVVARSGLGTLNHTALTVDALRDRGLDVPLVVLNEYEGASVAERTNPEELHRMLDVPIAPVGRFNAADPTSAIPAIAEALPDSLVREPGSDAST